MSEPLKKSSPFIFLLPVARTIRLANDILHQASLGGAMTQVFVFELQDVGFRI